MIPYADYREFVPEVVGDQTRLNHTNCTAGSDTRKRLYVKNTGDVAIAYCHNCGNHGYHRLHRGVRTADAIRRLLDSSSKLEQEEREVRLPDDMVDTPALFPAEAKAWLYKYQLTDEDIVSYNLGYSPGWRRVIIPVYRGGKCVFWQGRRIEGNGPKYISVKGEHKPIFLAHGQPGAVWHGTAIVEDALSAIRAANHSWPSIALLGTVEPDDILRHRADTTYNFLVWLDEDRAGRERTVELANRLKLILPGSGTIWVPEPGTPQPKKLSDGELDEVIFKAV